MVIFNRQDSRRKTVKPLASFLLLLVLASFFVMPSSAAAQAPEPVIKIHSLDTTNFPTLTFNLDFIDENGGFNRSLTSKDLSVVENGIEQPVNQLSVVSAKTQIVVALNPAMVMVNQYQGSSYFEKIQTALIDWMKKQPVDGKDDYNLVVNDGVLALHLTKPSDMTQAIAEYNPNLYTVKTNLNSLNTALEMSTDPGITADVKKELLYITPVPSPDILIGLPEVIERVKAAGLRVDVWLVSASPSVTARGADGLKQLAESSGGDYIIFSGRETLPDPDKYLNAIRGQYRITYQSKIVSGQQQNLQLRITRDDSLLESNTIGFDFEVQPPNPILLDPPSSIMMPVISVSGNTASQSGFDQPIRALIEFPDGHTRPLKMTQLYVDGQLVDENTSIPFDEFTWPVTEESVNIRHMLQVRAEDTLGLVRASSPVPIDVVENPESRNLLEKIASSERFLTASAIAAAALAIIILLWLTSRRNRFKVRAVAPPAVNSSHARAVPPVNGQPAGQPTAFSQAPTIPLKFRPSQHTGPAAISPPKPAKEIQIEPHAAKRKISFSKPARLVRLDQANRPIPGGEFLVTRAEVTIGSSPAKSILVIDLPSVDAMHARLIRTMDDNYFLADCGSLGGTWVNFAPVSSRGVHLADGDLIHFGRTPFRFELARPEDALMPVSGEERKK